jgi:hypothetical protein
MRVNNGIEPPFANADSGAGVNPARSSNVRRLHARRLHPWALRNGPFRFRAIRQNVYDDVYDAFAALRAEAIMAS